MPNMRKCLDTGAVIFDLTEDEKQVLDMKRDLEKTLSEAKELLERLKSNKT